MTEKTPEQQKRIDEAWDTIYNMEIPEPLVPSIDEYFSWAPEGAFSYDDTEAGDWHVYSCGDSDCPVGWHLVAYATDIGRTEDGKRYVEIRDVDEDGNWDFVSAYDEREGDGPSEWHNFAREEAINTNEYFRGWAQYWVNCADTGTDPCNQALFSAPSPSDPEWIDFCLDAAADNMRYYTMKSGNSA